MSDTTVTVDGYLAALPEAQRAALERLRALIRAAAPAATEAIGYGVPGFRLDGPLVSYGAGKAHCALYVQSPAVMQQLAAELTGLDTSKGTVRFTPDAPLPERLVTLLVEARIVENAAIVARRKRK